MSLTEGLHGRLTDLDPLSLVKGQHQLSVCPIGSIKPWGLGPFDHPLANHGRQVGAKLRRCARRFARVQALQPVGALGIQPALDTAGSHPQVLGNTAVALSPVGHQDELNAIPEFALCSGAKYIY
jgi:hypothetical protein